MGNKSSKGGGVQKDDPLIRKLFKECLGHVDELDESMMGFLQVLDMMTATLRMMTNYQSTLTDDKLTQSETISQSDLERIKLTQDVLVHMEESVCREKCNALQKLRKLLQFIVDTAKSYNSTLTFGDLQLDVYVDKPTSETSFMSRLRQTQENEIKVLKEKQELLKQQIEIFSERENVSIEENKEIYLENERLNKLNELKYSENEDLKNTVSRLELEMKNLNEMRSEKEEEIVQLKSCLESEKQTTEDLRNENEEIKDELEKLKVKKVLQVQLFYNQRRGSLISEVEDNLKGLLKKHVEDENTELKFISCNSSSEISPEMPTLLISICASRLGIDAASAIHGLNLNQKTVLLIFHHKDAHALPSQTSDRVLTGHEFKSLGGIFDLAFSQQKGVYSCEMNDKSINMVLNFLNGCISVKK